MILYRILRKADGKAFVSNSNWPHGGYWGSGGSFFKKAETIANHLDNLCYDWKCVSIHDIPWHDKFGTTHYISDQTELRRVNAMPDLSRLDNYIVEKLKIIASKADHSDAASFMKMVQECHDRARIRA